MTTQVLPRKRPSLMLLLVLVAMVATTWRTAPAQAATLLPAQAAANTQSQDDGEGDADTIEKTGLLEAMPAGGGLGEYKVRGITFAADADTEFETENGPVAVGACVMVTAETTSPSVAEKIETLPAASCNGDDDDDDDNPGDDNDGDKDDDDNEIEYYGRVVSLPAGGREGTWVVGDRTFTADGDTEFEQENGGLAVGACVEVEADEATPTVAEKIETESSYKCNGDDDDGDGEQEWEGKLFGTITALPSTPDLLGDWTVGTFTFVVTTTTRLDDEDDGDFAVGALVKVEFVVDNGRTIAREVELVYGDRDDDGNGDDDDHRGELGHAWGSIVTFPAGFIGAWDISGIQYQVTSETRLKQNNGAFAPGARVKVKFYTATDGSLVAWEIKTTSERGGVEDDNKFKFVGFVEVAPQGTLIGEWTIGGEVFTTTVATKFEEDDGLLVKGAYVEVEYKIQDGKRIVHQLESEMPPGSGDDDSAGKIEQGGDDSDDDSTAMAAAAINATPGSEIWRIGGRNYLVTTSTELNSNGGPLTVGSSVTVNSYTNTQGQLVATRIAGVTFTSFQFLPLGVRN